MRETGVLARSNDPNSVAVSNWAESTDYVGNRQGEERKGNVWVQRKW
jgi:hypothetical protein